MERTFETNDPVILYVELGKGSVNVTAADTTTATVEATGDHADEVQVELEGRQLTVIGPRQRTGFFGGGDPSIVLTITVPTDSELVTKTGSADVQARGRYALAKIKAGSGNVTLESVTGPAVVDAGSGDIAIRGAGGDLRVKSGSGDVSVDETGSTVGISTGSGDVEIGTTAASTVIKSGSGDLHVGQAHGDVSLSTTSGDVVVGTQHRGGLQAKNVSGDVTVGIPSGIPVWTDVSTVTGRIGSDLEGAGQPRQGEDYIEVRATTVSGDIRLKQL